MKAKLSVTLDQRLLEFVDKQPGANRSDKLEEIVRRYKQVKDDFALRKELAKFNAMGTDDDADAWRKAMEAAQWNESDAVTSGQSLSRRSRSRGQR